MFGIPASTAVLDDMPIGAILQSHLDLEYLTGGRWKAMNGRDIDRGKVHGLISNLHPCGPLNTLTNRTLSAVPVVASIDASPNNFVAAAASGAAPIQYSTDGITWSQASIVMGTSGSVTCLRFCGSRWITVYAAINAAGAIQCTTADNPGSTWLNTTNAVQPNNSGFNDNILCYSPQLALTAVIQVSQTGIMTLPDGSNTCTLRTRTAMTMKGLVWTGRLFFGIGAGNQTLNAQTSPDGTTWTDIATIGWDTTTATGIASDGAGNIVISFPTYFLVSNDHGTSWGKVYPPPEFALARDDNYVTAGAVIRVVKYQNGRFIANTGTIAAPTSQVLFSLTGQSWQVETPTKRVNNVGGAFLMATMAWKGTTVAGINTAAVTTSQTAVEDITKFRMPATFRAPEVTTLQPAGMAVGQEYIKTRYT